MSEKWDLFCNKTLWADSAASDVPGAITDRLAPQGACGTFATPADTLSSLTEVPDGQ